MTMKRMALLAATWVAFAIPAMAQWSGLANETVIYAISKGQADLKISPANATNAGITGFQVINSATVAPTPILPDFPAKQISLLHNESNDRFELVTNVENIVSSRYQNQITSKLLFLNGILRDENPGSVSTEPFDATGGLYVPYLPGIAAGPDYAIEKSTYLFWTPSSTTPPFVSVPDGTPSNYGPAGETGYEVEASSGVAAFFVPWVNSSVVYPNAGWPEGVDIKILDQDLTVGNKAFLIRFRPGAYTPTFSFSANTHLFVIQGNSTIQPAGAAAQTFNLNYYAFVPSGFSLSISNPFPYSGPGASQ